MDGSHISIVDGGTSNVTVMAGQTFPVCSWSCNTKSLPEGLCFFTVSSRSTDFAESGGGPTEGFQDAWAVIRWSCRQKGQSEVVVDLRPNFTFCIAADTMSIEVGLAQLQPLPFWPGVNSIAVTVSGTYGHGYRRNRLKRTAMGGRANPGVITLDRPNFATSVFARVSPDTTPPIATSSFQIFGGGVGIATPTYVIDIAGGVTNAARYTGDIPLASQDIRAVLALGDPPRQTGVIGYNIEF